METNKLLLFSKEIGKLTPKDSMIIIFMPKIDRKMLKKYVNMGKIFTTYKAELRFFSSKVGF